MIDCLLQFYQEQDWLDFKYAELDAVIELAGLSPRDLYNISQLSNEEKNSTYLRIKFPDEESIRFVCGRCILVKAIFEYWASGNSLEELVSHIKSLPEPFLSHYYHSQLSWSIQLDTFFRALTMDEKKTCRSKLNFMTFQGSVKLEKADTQYYILMDFSTSRKVSTDQCITEIVGVYCFFGRLLGLGGMREELNKYSLKRRLYLGPTTVIQTSQTTYLL